MASSINASTSGAGGVITTADNTGILNLQTAGTTAVTVDASQNVGIGTTSILASTKLDVRGAISSYDGGTQESRLNTDGNIELSKTAGDAFIDFKTSTSEDYDCRIQQESNGLRFLTGGNGSTSERMRISSVGNVDIGTTANTSKVSILQSTNAMALNIGNENTIDGGYYGVAQITRPANPTGNYFHLAFIRQGNKIAGMGFLDNSDTFAIQNKSDNLGNGVTLTDGATSWGTTSDERKKDIVGNVEDALLKISDWRSVYYKYKTDEEDEPQRVGLIAQDVQKTLPEAISVEKDDIQTLQLRYTETIPVLVKAIQEQQTIINDLKARITALEGAA
jgi:hypothetical protein